MFCLFLFAHTIELLVWIRLTETHLLSPQTKNQRLVLCIHMINVEKGKRLWTFELIETIPTWDFSICDNIELSPVCCCVGTPVWFTSHIQEITLEKQVPLLLHSIKLTLSTSDPIYCLPASQKDTARISEQKGRIQANPPCIRWFLEFDRAWMLRPSMTD